MAALEGRQPRLLLSLALRLAGITLWSIPAALAEDKQCVIEDKNDPYHSSLCACWERLFEQIYPDVTYSVCEQLHTFPDLDAEFKAWIQRYKKEYSGDEKLKSIKFGYFAANYVFVMIENQQTTDYELDIANEFADMSPDEFQQTHMGLGASHAPTDIGHLESEDGVPESMDWDAVGGVNTPEDQGNANSCWAFATAAAISGGWFARTRTLYKLSVQQFVDCTGSWLSAENGGDLTTPLTNVAKNHAICSADSYPYTKSTDICKQDDCHKLVPYGAIIGYKSVTPRDEYALKVALLVTGPVSVGIDAFGPAVQFYRRGVLTKNCNATLNHAVLVVGYGIADVKYWKLKNSWGPNWGEHGFFRILRGKEGTSQCGVLEIPTFPQFASDLSPLGINSTYDPSVWWNYTDARNGGTLGEPFDDWKEAFEESWADCSDEKKVAVAILLFLGFVVLCVCPLSLLVCCLSRCCRGGRKSRSLVSLEGSGESSDEGYLCDGSPSH